MSKHAGEIPLTKIYSTRKVILNIKKKVHGSGLQSTTKISSLVTTTTKKNRNKNKATPRVRYFGKGYSKMNAKINSLSVYNKVIESMSMGYLGERIIIFK